MWRLAVLLAGCQNVYAPFMGDGGPITGGTTVIGGNTNPDLSVIPDGGASALPPGLIRARSSTQSRISADFDLCAGTAVSGCTLTACAGADMAAGGLHPNIGAITVMTPSTNHTLSPQGDGTYLPLAVSGTLWSAAGATVNITATGADYAAFSAMLPGPTSITVTNPQAGALDVPRTGDLTITWTDGTTGHVTVEIDGAMQSLSCDFVVASGSAIVPRQALSMLDAGAATMTLFVANTFLVDNVVTVSAETPGLDSGGLPFSANVNLR